MAWERRGLPTHRAPFIACGYNAILQFFLSYFARKQTAVIRLPPPKSAQYISKHDKHVNNVSQRRKFIIMLYYSDYCLLFHLCLFDFHIPLILFSNPLNGCRLHGAECPAAGQAEIRRRPAVFCVFYDDTAPEWVKIRCGLAFCAPKCGPPARFCPLRLRCQDT
jgi:hypothetical protein